MFATMRSFSSQADESALSLRERARAEGARVRVSGFDHTATLTGLFCLLLALTPSANAETVAKAGRFGGITIRYKIVLPNAYDPARAYPAILAFAGGRQNLDAVNNMLERNWLPEAEARGYIIVSPIAPPNHFFRNCSTRRDFASTLSNGGGRYAPMTLHVKLHSEFACQNQRRIEVFVVHKRMRR